jgi:cysteine synthase A
MSHEPETFQLIFFQTLASDPRMKSSVELHQSLLTVHVFSKAEIGHGSLLSTPLVLRDGMVFSDVNSSVGRTPLIELKRLDTLGARVFVKMESRNPCGSVKDRVGVALIDDAEKRGVLKPGATLIEPTSGNTGIALAFAAAAKGYRLTLTMPEHISRERVAFLRMLGAEIVFTPGALMREAVRKAEELLAATPGAIMLQQFKNPANPEIHRRTTAEEIWSDTGGEVDVFVSGVGTGGTITGVGEVLKARRPGCRVVAVEPAAAAVLSGKPPGSHHLPGLGAGFVPEILNRAIIDEIIAVTEEQAVRAQLDLAHREGIAAGMSSGAALVAALAIAGRPGSAGKRIVVVLPDGGERYAGSPVFNEIARSIGG